MQICGFMKTTLLDYPEHVAATVFTGGCNFRCPFCHNGDLVQHSTTSQIPEQEVLSYLAKRRNMLDGVCVTGGEPTLKQDLASFLRKIKELGLLVKLDTNGYRPEVLQELLDEQLLDYVAMDIKNCPNKYAMTAGVADFDLSPVQQSIHMLMTGEVPYEFRTTVVRQLHERKDFIEIGTWIRGAKAYYLQSYQENEHVISPGFDAYSKEELLEIKESLLPYIPAVELRGMEQ